MRVIPAVPAIVLALLISPVPAFEAAGKTGPDVTEICKTTKCRQPGTFKLRTKKGEEELENFGLPYVYMGHVYVLPGDEFDIEIDFAADGKPAIALPGDTPRPKHTIHVKFTQMDGKQDMMLSLQNGTGATVKYDAYMTVPDGRNLYTTSCPLRSGLGAFEHWPHPIVRLRLTNFRKVAGSTMLCE